MNKTIVISLLLSGLANSANLNDLASMGAIDGTVDVFHIIDNSAANPKDRKITANSLAAWFFASPTVTGTLTVSATGHTLSDSAGDLLIDPSSGVAIVNGSLTANNLIAGTATADGEIQIYDDDAGGDAVITIQAPDALGTNYTLVLPPNDGGAGQVLQTDGGGVLTWENDASSAFDSTTVDATTWSDGTNASNIWTFDVSGTDTTLTFGNGTAGFSHALTAAGAISGSNLSGTNTGDQTTAGPLTVVTTAFAGNFANDASHDTVQELMDVVDDLTLGIGSVVEDTTPQLGGGLDVNGNEITGTIDLHTTASITAQLSDDAGASALNILNDTGATVASIDSLGAQTVTSVSTSSFVLLDGAGIEVEGSSDALADDTYQATKVIAGRNAGETITQWDLVYLNVADGEWHQADADESAAAGKAWGIATTAGTDGNPIDVIVSGIIRNDGWTWSAAAVDLYVSDTAGELTETAPATTGDVVKLVARTLSDDEIYIDVTPHFIISD